MTAAFDVKYAYGGTSGSPGNEDTVGNVRMRTDDTNTQDTTNPIPVVSGQTRRSFWKHIYLKCTTAPSTKCDNLKVYTDGGGWTGVDLFVASNLQNTNAADTDYEVALGTVGTDGSEMVSFHADVSSKANFFNKTSGSPMNVQIYEASNQIDAINEETGYIAIQMDVDGDTASPGSLASETITWQYDEI